VTTHIQIQIEGKVLEPGQYVMKLLDSADRHVVQIYNFDTAALEMTVLAMPDIGSTPRAIPGSRSMRCPTEKLRPCVPGSTRRQLGLRVRRNSLGLTGCRNSQVYINGGDSRVRREHP
jgi:hypothetical protein